MQLLQIGQKLTRSKIVKYSKDTKGHDAPNSPSSKTLKKNKAIKGLTKTKTTKKEEKGKEDERNFPLKPAINFFDRIRRRSSEKSEESANSDPKSAKANPVQPSPDDNNT